MMILKTWIWLHDRATRAARQKALKQENTADTLWTENIDVAIEIDFAMKAYRREGLDSFVNGLEDKCGNDWIASCWCVKELELLMDYWRCIVCSIDFATQDGKRVDIKTKTKRMQTRCVAHERLGRCIDLIDLKTKSWSCIERVET